MTRYYIFDGGIQDDENDMLHRPSGSMRSFIYGYDLARFPPLPDVIAEAAIAWWHSQSPDVKKRDADFLNEVASLEIDCQRLQATVAERDATIKRLQDHLEDREQTASICRDMVAERDATIAELERRLDARMDDITERDAEIAELRKQLTGLAVKQPDACINASDDAETKAATLSGEFMECAHCGTKPGTPLLCAACLHNREVIGMLQKQLATVSTNLELRTWERDEAMNREMDLSLAIQKQAEPKLSHSQAEAMRCLDEWYGDPRDAAYARLKAFIEQPKLCGPSAEEILTTYTILTNRNTSLAQDERDFVAWLKPKMESIDSVKADAEASYVRCSNCDCLVERASTKPNADSKPICIDYAIRSGCRLKAERDAVESQFAERFAEFEAKIKELEAELHRRDEYDKRVPDPRNHKYIDPECCESGCKGLLVESQAKRIGELETTLANERELSRAGFCFTDLERETRLLCDKRVQELESQVAKLGCELNAEKSKRYSIPTQIERYNHNAEDILRWQRIAESCNDVANKALSYGCHAPDHSWRDEVALKIMIHYDHPDKKSYELADAFLAEGKEVHDG